MILGREGVKGFGEDENGVFVHYNGMQIYYAVDSKQRGSPEHDDRVIAVKPFP